MIFLRNSHIYTLFSIGRKHYAPAFNLLIFSFLLFFILRGTKKKPLLAALFFRPFGFAIRKS